jgi:hypothetical protein
LSWGPLVSQSHRLTDHSFAGLMRMRQMSAMHRGPEHHRPRAPPRASLSATRLGSEVKADFFTPHSHLRCTRCFSPSGLARACCPPLFTAAAVPGEPPPQATHVVTLMRFGASPTVSSSCSAHRAGPKTARGRQPPSTSSTTRHLTTDGPPPAPNHPAATSSSTPPTSCCSLTSPPTTTTSPPVCHR